MTKHKLTFLGQGEKLWAQCSCGNCFLATYIPRSRKRAYIKAKHRERCLPTPAFDAYWNGSIGASVEQSRIEG